MAEPENCVGGEGLHHFVGARGFKYGIVYIILYFFALGFSSGGLQGEGVSDSYTTDPIAMPLIMGPYGITSSKALACCIVNHLSTQLPSASGL